MHPLEQAVHPPKRFSIKMEYPFPKEKPPIRVAFLLGSDGEIRIIIEHAGGVVIGQCKHWSILLFLFAVIRKGKRNASESLRQRQFVITLC